MCPVFVELLLHDGGGVSPFPLFFYKRAAARQLNLNLNLNRCAAIVLNLCARQTLEAHKTLQTRSDSAVFVCSPNARTA